MCDLKEENEEYFLRNWLRMPRREREQWLFERPEVLQSLPENERAQAKKDILEMGR
jgi:hypothetical protein